MINSRLFKAGCLAAALSMAVMLFVLAKTAVGIPLFPPPLDKAAHFVYYGIIAGLLSHAVGLRWLIVPLILVPVIGAADEWHQMFVVGRDASFWDWMADEFGTVVAVYAYWKWTRRQ